MSHGLSAWLNPEPENSGNERAAAHAQNINQKLWRWWHSSPCTSFHSYEEEDTCVSYKKEEDTCVSYKEEEDTCVSWVMAFKPMHLFPRHIYTYMLLYIYTCIIICMYICVCIHIHTHDVYVHMLHVCVYIHNTRKPAQILPRQPHLLQLL